MAVQPLGTSPGVASGAAAASGSNRLPGDLGRDEFLELLITKLRYQDPLNPEKDEAFVAQLAQFTTLESMQRVDRAVNLQSGVAMLGRTVQANGTAGPVSGSVRAVRQTSDGAVLLTLAPAGGESDTVEVELGQVQAVQVP